MGIIHRLIKITEQAWQHADPSWSQGWKTCVDQIYLNDRILKSHSLDNERPKHWQQYLDKNP